MTAATQFIAKTYQRPYREVKRVATAVYDSANRDHDYILELAKKFTHSPDEARAAVLEMKADIQRCGERGESIAPNEDGVTVLIAWRRLLKFLH